jgi:uncharacterized protein (TIGR00730 family)
MTTVCVFTSSAEGVDQQYHDLATAAGAAIAERGWTLLYGGTPTGTMHALADAARRASGRVEGVCLESFVDLGIHDTEADDLLVVTSLGERKEVMIHRSDAFVVLPGGFGTVDELLEIVSQRQLRMHKKPCVIVDHGGYYTPLLAFFELMRSLNFAYDTTIGAYQVAQDVPSAMTALRHALAEPA